MIKTVLYSTTALGLLAGAANAADLSYPVAPMVPVVEEGINWGGIYLGLHGGWGMSDATSSYNDDFYNDPDVCGFDETFGCAVDVDPEGAFVGGQIGWQHQWNNWVLGIEADYSAASLSDDGNGEFQGGDSATHVDLDVTSMAAIQAKLGWAHGSWLPYVTAGWGMAEAERSAYNNDYLPVEGTHDSATHDGLILGVGLDYAINNNWIVGINYRYFNGGTENYPGLGFADGTDIDLNIHSVRFSVNYKFGH